MGNEIEMGRGYSNNRRWRPSVGIILQRYEIFAVLPLAMTLGAGVVITLELLLRQDGLYLKHIENKVNKVAGLELLQYYTKYSRVLGGMGYESGGMIPKSFMSILYFFFLPIFFFLWILFIKLAMTEYITPTFNTWIEVLVLVFYIGLLVASVVLLPLGFRKINNRFDFINKQDKI